MCCRSIVYALQIATNKLENVAINDVLSLNAARIDAIVNIKYFGAPGHHRSNFDGFIN